MYKYILLNSKLMPGLARMLAGSAALRMGLAGSGRLPAMQPETDIQRGSTADAPEMYSGCSAKIALTIAWY